LQTKLNKSDSDKINDLIIDLVAITEYSFESKKNKKTHEKINISINKMIDYIQK